jgi:hypothetical protein
MMKGSFFFIKVVVNSRIIATMDEMVSIKNMPEDKLSRFQQLQTGNSCAICSACAAVNLLFGTNIQAGDWIQRVDCLPFPQIFKVRMWKNGPTAPFQQINLIRWIAGENNLYKIQVEQKKSNREELIQIIQNPFQAALVTIGWIFNKPPEITLGSTGINYNASKDKIGYHTLLAAAYQSDHICEDHVLRPWGFINSWVAGGTDLFWMSEEEFMDSWSIYTPPNRIRSTVLLTRH